MTFETLDVQKEIVKALNELRITEPTQIQEKLYTANKQLLKG